MSTFIDFEEKSVDKAIEKACAQLNIQKDKLKYDIISYGSSGIFGLVGAKKALIRVSLPETDRKEAEEPAKEAMDETAGISALVDEAFGPVESEEVTEDASKKESPPIEHEKKEALQEWIISFLNRVIELISPEASINVKEIDSVYRFQITGGDSARLIGKKGQTLDAIQYLVEKAVSKKYGNNISVEIDVEDYLEKRKTEISEMASRLAEKAQQTGKPMVINRLNAQDRRFVHISLRENRNVRTQSVGNGDYRKLLILPKKKSKGKKSGSKQPKS